MRMYLELKKKKMKFFFGFELNKNMRSTDFNDNIISRYCIKWNLDVIKGVHPVVTETIARVNANVKTAVAVITKLATVCVPRAGRYVLYS